MTPLRILVTADPELPVPPRLYGGIERVIALLVDGLVARGHEVTLVAHRDSVTAGRLAPYGRADSRAMSVAANGAAIARAARRARPQVIHSFGRLASLAGVFPTRTPKIMSYQRAITPRSVTWGRRLSFGRLSFTACSDRMLEGVRDLAPWRVIPNAVDTARYRFAPTVAADAPLVFLGRVEHIKGPHVAIDVARRAGRRLVIAGNVPDEHRAYFDRHIKPHVNGDRVTYLGPVDDAAKSELLAGAAALLMPILWEEPFGIVMAEALACGTPVIGLTRGAVPEVVDDGVTGAVCADEEGLVRAVERIVQLQSWRVPASGRGAIQPARVGRRLRGALSRSLRRGGRPMSARVCLVSTGQPSTNPRLVKEADALAANGFDVHVIGAHWADWADRADVALLADRSWSAQVIDWREASAPWLFWKTRARHFGARAAFASGITAAEVRDAAVGRLTPELTAAAVAWPADLYIAHNLGALPAAAAAARRHGARLGFDAEDYHRGQAPKGDTAARALAAACEERYLPECDYVTAASPGIAEAYAGLSRTRPLVVLNVCPLADWPAAPVPSRGGPLRLYWFSQTIGRDRGIEAVIRAMGVLAPLPIELHLRGVWPPGFASTLQAVAHVAGAPWERVVRHDPAAPGEMVRLAAEFDVGLATEPGHTENADLALSNKIFTYLLAGVPVLATATTAQAELAPAFGDAAALAPVGDAQAIASALRGWIERPAELAAARQAAWQLGTTRYNWDLEQVKFLDAVRTTVRDGSRPARDLRGLAS